MVADNLDLPYKPFLNTEKGILFNADCLDILRKIKDQSVHCVFADPPFNLKKDYGSDISDDLKQEEYLLWLKEWINEAIRILSQVVAYLYTTFLNG